MSNNTSLKNWDTLSKFGFSWALGFTALCAVMAGLNYKNNQKGWTVAQSSFALINVASAIKIGYDARKRALQNQKD